MAKDPAFLFYPNDWIGGTMGMTFEEKGAYMELLMLQFNRGHMKKHMIIHTVGQVWDKIEDKFTQDENGLWYNQRLENEQNKRKAYSDSRRNNIKGKNQHHKSEDKIGHMTSHMENVNENVNENVIKGVQGEFFNGLTSIEIGATKEYVSITGQRDFTEKQILQYWKAYLIHSKGLLHGGRTRQLQHFRNWLKLQPNEKPKRITADPGREGTKALC